MAPSSRHFGVAALLSAILLWWPVASAQGPGGEFSEDRFLRALTAGREDSKLAALATLESYGDDPRVAELLIKVLKKTSTDGAVPDSTLWMMITLGEFTGHPEVRDMMLEYLGSTNWKVVMVAADTLGEIGDAEALEEITKLVQSPHYDRTYGFRKCVIQAVMKIEDPKSVEFLIERLPQLTGQLQYDVVRYLSHVSRQRFGTRTGHWKTWWEDNAEDFQFENTEEFSLEAPVPDDFSWDLEAPEFFGTYIYAKRLVFVLDISSSMLTNAGGQPRVALAKKELAEAIERLPDDTYFNILVFDARVVPWKRRMLPANQENRQDAVTWVRRINTGKGTASYDALERGFAVDGNTEAMFFLSDGKPSRGKIKDPAEILRVVTKENFFRRVALYNFAFKWEAGGEQFMRNLAERNNGLYKAIQ